MVLHYCVVLISSLALVCDTHLCTDPIRLFQENGWLSSVFWTNASISSYLVPGIPLCRDVRDLRQSGCYTFSCSRFSRSLGSSLNGANMLLHCLDHPEGSKGEIFNAQDEGALNATQWVQVIAKALEYVTFVLIYPTLLICALY